MGGENPAEKALILLRTRLCDPNFIFRPLCESSDSNYRSGLSHQAQVFGVEFGNGGVQQLNSASGKIAVLDLVIGDLLQEYPDSITVIRLSGLLHSDENCALKGKQLLLYNLLDALQSVTSQAVVIGVSCRLDADQLLEKRVISRFSNRKLLFLPPSKEDIQRLLEYILLLPTDSSLPTDYVVEFNAKLQNILADEKFKEIINTYLNFDSTVKDFLRYLFRAVSNMDLQSGMLSLENFKTALSNIQRHPKMESIKDCSILELYLLVCMKRLEVKEQNSYNFTAVMKEYKCVHDSFQTSDYYAKNVCLRAFEHLLLRGLIEFMDNRGQNQSVEYRPVKLLISFQQLHQGLKSYRSCPLSRYASSPPPSTPPRHHHLSPPPPTTATSSSPPSAFLSPSSSSHRFRPVISDPDLLLRVLSQIQTRPAIALRFFRWVQSHPDVTRSEFVFCVMLEILARNHMVRSAYWVVEKVTSLDMTRAVASVLIRDYVFARVSDKLLDLILFVCAKKLLLEQCLSIFDDMIRNGVVPDVINCNRIVRMLRDKGMGGRAKQVYRMMCEAGIKPTIVTYNTMLDLFCKQGDVREAVGLVSEMQKVGCVPNDVTYNVLISGLAKKGEMEEAVGLMQDMVKAGLRASAYTYNSLICEYCKRGMLEEALSLWEEMEARGAAPTVVAYNSIIYGLCKWSRVTEAKDWLGDIWNAFLLFDELRHRGLTPTVVTFNTLMDGLCRLGEFEFALQLKKEMVNQGVSPDVFTYTILVNRYCKAGNLSKARELFDEMLHNGLQPDRFAYNTRIVGELDLGDPSKAFNMQEEMQAKGLPPDLFIYNVFVDVICKLGNLKEAYILVQKMIRNDLVPDHVIFTSIIHAYLVNGRLRKAREVFDEMLSKDILPSVVTYTIMIHAHAAKGKLELASMYFSEMQEKRVLPNVVTYNALINGLCKVMRMGQAYEFFTQMEEKGILPNKYTYTILINENCNIGNWEEALRLYKQMLDREIEPDFCTHSALFKQLHRDYELHAAKAILLQAAYIRWSYTANDLLNGCC
ncbi:hypothetical protein ACLB2K_034420 [Fragaria x ananassa]